MNEIVHGDCFELLPQLEDASVDLVFVDPPYNIGKASWDKIDGYLDWCAEWIAECSRVLKPNGAFWISHSKPMVLAQLSALVAAHGRGLVNWITWDKYNEAAPNQKWRMNQTKLHPQGKRSWDQDAEYLIYHADEGDWTSQCDKERGFIFEPLRVYIENERMRADVHKEDVNEALGFRRQGGMASRHYFSRSQWCLPTEEHYKKMQALFNKDGDEFLRREYEDLRREYEDLRAEFESLRYTFNNPGKMSSVWQIPPAPSNGHPTPKPERLLEIVIEATSNPGDVILDPMCGSGTTAAVAKRLGREFIAFEKSAKYVRLANERLETIQPELPIISRGK